ncbi:GNAT family N-acetyltransferase [Pseudooceanicola sp. 502str34]
MTSVHLCSPDDLTRLMPMVSAFHEEMGITQTDEAREAALMPLLEGSPHGVAYLIGPARAPIGYIVITFGWSLELGGMEGFVDEFYIRAGVRGRGIGAEVLHSLPTALSKAGLKALHLEVRKSDARVVAFYKRQKFALRDDYVLMTRRF